MGIFIELALAIGLTIGFYNTFLKSVGRRFFILGVYVLGSTFLAFLLFYWLFFAKYKGFDIVECVGYTTGMVFTVCFITYTLTYFKRKSLYK